MKRCLLVLSLTLALTKATAADPVRQRVYMFGFAASFKDSVAYITDVQAIDSAYIAKKGFLADRSLYSMQLSSFLLENYEKGDMTCAVFFDVKKSKLEKKYLKIRKKYKDDHVAVLASLGNDVFAFEAEEWISPTEMITTAQEEAQEPVNESPWTSGQPAEEETQEPKGESPWTPDPPSAEETHHLLLMEEYDTSRS